MIIQSYTYRQHEGQPQAWKIGPCKLHPSLNLIVGKNASGKTRIVNTIGNLADLLSGRRTRLFSSGNLEVVFRSGPGEEMEYSLRLRNLRVLEEKLSRNGRVLMEREESGKGSIWAEEEQKTIRFQIAPSELAALKKCDSVQHPFLQELSLWANSSRIYPFATDFGRNTFEVFPERRFQADLPPGIGGDFEKDPNRVVVLLRNGAKKFGDPFLARIKEDMESIGYELDAIAVEPLESLESLFPLQGIHLTERDLRFKVPQNEISQGMFRALALIVHLNYLKFCSSPQGCVLIDDIGEGLDFERSSRLVKILLEKFPSCAADFRGIQFVMTSNDRFVMNGIPLDHWLLLERIPGGARIVSKENSPEIFQEFEFTGLNNFDFLASEHFKG